MGKLKIQLFALLFANLFMAGAYSMHAIELPAVIGENMVLQQGKKVKIWGKAAPGENITVRFKRQSKKTKADAAGNWAVSLDELKASAEPSVMQIAGAGEKITLKNILVGEVWLASGQSNMEYPLNNERHKYAKPKKGNPNYLQDAFRAAQDSRLRVLYVKRDLKSKTLPSDGWRMPDSTALSPTSAAAYFFAKKIMAELNVPVGIITSAWGGTPIENWTPRTAYESDPELAASCRDGRLDGEIIGNRFEAMIQPIAPFAFAGFLWYQGEANLSNGDTEIYAAKQKALIQGWRALWQDQTMPFYFAQLAPYHYSHSRTDRVAHTWEALPLFWQAQIKAAREVPHTGMAATADLVDDLDDIHPSYKWIVGERLALCALAGHYGRKGTVFSGPVLKDMQIDGNKAILKFDSMGSGLKSLNADGSLSWFEIGSGNGKFRKAKAVIVGGEVIVSSDKVKNPAEIRYAWDEEAVPDFFNNEGLPALAFRIRKDQ